MSRETAVRPYNVWPDLDFIRKAASRSASVFGLCALGASVAFLAGQSIALSQRSQFWLSLVFACVCLVGMEVVRSAARDRQEREKSSSRVVAIRWAADRIRRAPAATLVLLGISFPFFAAVSVASMRASPSLDLITPTGVFGAVVVLAACAGLGLFAVRRRFRRLFFVLLPGSIVCYQVIVNDFRSQLGEAEAKFQAIAVEQTLHAVKAYRRASETLVGAQGSADLVARAVAERLGAFYKDQRIGMGNISVRVGADHASVVMLWRRRSVATPFLGVPEEYEIARYLPVVATAVDFERISYQSARGVGGSIQTRGVLTSTNAARASSVSVGNIFVAQLTDDRRLDRPSAQLTSLLGNDREARVVLVSGAAAQ